MGRVTGTALPPKVAIPGGLLFCGVLLAQNLHQWLVFAMMAFFLFAGAISVKSPKNPRLRRLLQVLLWGALLLGVVGGFAVGWREGLAYLITFFSAWIAWSAVAIRRGRVSQTTT